MYKMVAILTLNLLYVHAGGYKQFLSSLICISGFSSGCVSVSMSPLIISYTVTVCLSAFLSFEQFFFFLRKREKGVVNKHHYGNNSVHV